MTEQSALDDLTAWQEGEELVVTLPAWASSAEVDLLDVLGQAVMPAQRIAAGEQLRMNVDGMPTGLYFLRCLVNGRPSSRRIVLK
jgi:hypothetical protein